MNLARDIEKSKALKSSIQYLKKPISGTLLNKIFKKIKDTQSNPLNLLANQISPIEMQQTEKPS